MSNEFGWMPELDIFREEPQEVKNKAKDITDNCDDEYMNDLMMLYGFAEHEENSAND